MTETPLLDGLIVQLLLLQDDVGVAAEIGEVAAALDRGLGHGPVVVVGNGAHHRRLALERRMDCGGVGDIEANGAQPALPVAREKLGQLSGLRSARVTWLTAGFWRRS